MPAQPASLAWSTEPMPVEPASLAWRRTSEYSWSYIRLEELFHNNAATWKDVLPISRKRYQFRPITNYNRAQVDILDWWFIRVFIRIVGFTKLDFWFLVWIRKSMIFIAHPRMQFRMLIINMGSTSSYFSAADIRGMNHFRSALLAPACTRSLSQRPNLLLGRPETVPRPNRVIAWNCQVEADEQRY